MSNESVLYAQVGSFISFVMLTFVLYRLLIKQKDSTIELLKERISTLDFKVKELERKAPDALVDSLHRRVEIATAEIQKLSSEGELYKGQIDLKEDLLKLYKFKLDMAVNLAADPEFACPYCNSPIAKRDVYVIHCPDGDADVDYFEYECGYIRDQGSFDRCRPCGNTGNGGYGTDY